MADKSVDELLASLLESELVSDVSDTEREDSSDLKGKRALARRLRQGILGRYPLNCSTISSSSSPLRYCMRWQAASSIGKFRASAWKKLYIKRDQEDMVEFVRNCPEEFKEYYIQMQAAKRIQLSTSRLSVADQVSMWKSKRGLTDELLMGHFCSGNICSYTHLGERNKSGRCSDGWVSAEEETDTDADQQQAGADEAEP